MKIKNLVVLAILASVGILNSAFVNPDVEVGGEISFTKFLSYFEKTELPFEINLEDLDKYENFKHASKIEQPVRKLTKAESKKLIDEKIAHQKMIRAINQTDFIPEISYGRFGRMGPPEVQPVARFYPNEKSVAVVYTTTPRFGRGINENYRMVIYDLKGNTIFPLEKGKSKKKKKIFSVIRNGFELGHSTAQNSITFKIDKKGRIWKTTFENVWKNDLKEIPLDNNELVSFNVKDTEVFQIGDFGISKLKSIPTSARASIN